MRRILTILALPLLLACTAPAPVPQDSPLTQATGQGQTLSCEPGKEHWRDAGPPKRGGTLNRGATPFGHLDVSQPTASSPLTAGAPQSNQGLVQVRGCSYEDLTMVPSLAKSWEASPDGRAWTFRLEERAKWHSKPPVNGRPFTAHDVVWTIDHQRKGGVLRPYYVDVTAEARDNNTVVFRTKEPDSDFVMKMGDFNNVMLAKEIQEQHGDFKTVAVGTGPWVLKDFKQAEGEITSVPNPDYYVMGADGKALPYLEMVRTIAFADDASHLAALRTGQIDIGRFNGIEKTDADILKQASPQTRIYEQIVFTHINLWFDVNRKPFDDVRVRRAFSLAVDADDLIGRYQGAATPAGFMPPFLKDWAWPEAKVREKFKPDVEAGKRLLAEAGYNPADLNFVISTAQIFHQDAEVVQAHLKKLGVNTTIRVDAPNFQPIFQQSQFELAVGSRGGVFFPGYWAGEMVHSHTAPKHLQVKDPEVDRLAQAVLGEVDQAKRKEAVDRVQDRLFETMYYRPIVSRYYFHAVACRVKNNRLIVPTYNPINVTEAWLDPTGC